MFIKIWNNEKVMLKHIPDDMKIPELRFRLYSLETCGVDWEIMSNRDIRKLRGDNYGDKYSKRTI